MDDEVREVVELVDLRPLAEVLGILDGQWMDVQACRPADVTDSSSSPSRSSQNGVPAATAWVTAVAVASVVTPSMTKVPFMDSILLRNRRATEDPCVESVHEEQVGSRKRRRWRQSAGECSSASESGWQATHSEGQRVGLQAPSSSKMARHDASSGGESGSRRRASKAGLGVAGECGLDDQVLQLDLGPHELGQRLGDRGIVGRG